jgi:hypothetical protein
MVKLEEAVRKRQLALSARQHEAMAPAEVSSFPQSA